jgi:hypothetical protein
MDSQANPIKSNLLGFIAVPRWLGALLSGLGLGLLIASHWNHDTSRSTSDNSLAQLAAEHVARAVAAGDLINLQVAVADVIELPAVSGVVVHDVSRRPIAQAGTVEQHDQVWTSSAPVKNDQTLVGNISIIHPAEVSPAHSSVLLALLLAGVGLLIIWRGQTSLSPSLKPTIATPTTTPSKQMPDVVEPMHAISVGLYPRNLEQLEQQLAASLVNQELESHNEFISKVAKLYRATVIWQGDALAQLQFVGENQAGNACNAACATQLILANCYQGASKIKLRARIFATAGLDESPKPSNYRRAPTEVIFCLDRSLSSALEPVLTTAEGQSDDQWLEVKAFANNYEQLLSQQLSQLNRPAAQ